MKHYQLERKMMEHGVRVCSNSQTSQHTHTAFHTHVCHVKYSRKIWNHTIIHDSADYVCRHAQPDEPGMLSSAAGAITP